MKTQSLNIKPHFNSQFKNKSMDNSNIIIEIRFDLNYILET